MLHTIFRPISYLLWILLSTHIALAEQSSSSKSGLSLEQAVMIASEQNRSLKEIQASAEAMAAIPSQLATLPDPVVSFGLANLPTDSFSTQQEAMTQWQFGISQQLPFPGKLSLKSQAASDMAAATSYAVDERRQQLLRDVKTLWWQIFYLDKVISIVGLNKTLLKQFIEIAQTKYTVGQGLQQDVLLAQLELSRLLDRNIQLQSMREQEQARLNALLNRPVQQHIKLADIPSQPLTLPNIRPLTALFEQARENRPLLAKHRQLIATAKSNKALAEKDLLPDFKLSAAYGMRQGNNQNGSPRSDFISMQLGIKVPLFAEHKQKMAISQKNSELKQQQFALQDEWNQVQADISSTISRYHQAQQQLALLQTGILPQARQTVASMLAGYQVNKVDFLNLIRSQITLYDYETRFWQINSDAMSALAALVANVGEENIYE